MVETGIVNSIDGNIVKMGCGPNEGCESCSSSFCSTDTRVFEAINTQGLDIGRGDTVDVYLAPGKTVAAGFLVLIVPLILFATGYLVTGRRFLDWRALRLDLWQAFFTALNDGRKACR